MADVVCQAKIHQIWDNKIMNSEHEAAEPELQIRKR
jgi:hypothetical protein